MAKQIEPYEEDDFLLEDQQNSNEEQTIEEEDEAEEESTFKLRPRPARASLTHNAIKSELLKMKKQDSGEDNEENLSRSARKRKKRREKVLEERRASGGRCCLKEKKVKSNQFDCFRSSKPLKLFSLRKQEEEKISRTTWLTLNRYRSADEDPRCCH